VGMEAAAEPRDGRTVRAERTRLAVVDALLALLDEGELRPTAERIAQRAGVSERSIFQHFRDREALFEAAAGRQYERVMPTLHPVDATLPLDQRIEAFVHQRTRLFERVKGVRRAALLMEPESPAVASWLAAARRAKAIEVERVFSRELEMLPEDERDPVRAALVAASAWTAWESYRAHQRLGVDRARAAMCAALSALLGCAQAAAGGSTRAISS
jgi:TetR/AcrR family transcriptional regulator of autoinduction and epiphytic fitness